MTENCLRIHSTEHLPDERTLLIHYNILCSGTWDLKQLNTAYRNVCDDEWTVMYPNIQHPRHTDLPIRVFNQSYSATFAWNYGGIRGIDPEDFDDGHSYLTQLTLYKRDCSPVGGTGETNPIGGGPIGGTSGGGNQRPIPAPGPPGPPPPRPGDPPPPAPPWPGVPGGRIPPWEPIFQPLPPPPNPPRPFPGGPITPSGSGVPPRIPVPGGPITPPHSGSGDPTRYYLPETPDPIRIYLPPEGPITPGPVRTFLPTVPDPTRYYLPNPVTPIRYYIPDPDSPARTFLPDPTSPTTPIGSFIPDLAYPGRTFLSDPSNLRRSVTLSSPFVGGSITPIYADPFRSIIRESSIFINPVNSLFIENRSRLNSSVSTFFGYDPVNTLIRSSTSSFINRASIIIDQLSFAELVRERRAISSSFETSLSIVTTPYAVYNTFTYSKIDRGVGGPKTKQETMSLSNKYLLSVVKPLTLQGQQFSVVYLTSLMQGSIVSLQIGNPEIFEGESFVASGSFIPQAGADVDCQGILYFISQESSVYKLLETVDLTATNSSPLNLGGSFNSYMSRGTCHIVFVVLDQEGEVIAVAAEAVLIKAGAGEEGSLLDGDSIQQDLYTLINTTENDKVKVEASFFQTLYFLIVPKTAFLLSYPTSALITLNSTNEYKLTLKNPETGDIIADSTGASGNNSPVVGATYNNGSIVRVRTGLAESLLEISPSRIISNSPQRGYLYIDRLHKLKDPYVTITLYDGSKATVRCYSPYPSTTHKLIVHGYDPDNYTGETPFYLITSSTLGVCTWVNIPIRRGYWISVVPQVLGNFNLFTNLLIKHNFAEES